MKNNQNEKLPVERSDAGDASQLLDRPEFPAGQEPPDGLALSDIKPALMPDVMPGGQANQSPANTETPISDFVSAPTTVKPIC